jgi:hypothetical protein
VRRRIPVIVGLAVAGWCALGVPLRATYGARTTADEPQYLLSAISIAEDGDLDIADERDEGRWREFHESPLPVQEEPLPDGRRLSPHDPLLPVLLAVPVLVGGWVGAKLALAALAGALAAATVWAAVERFAVPVGVAVAAALAYGLAAPLAFYGTQVYPEVASALAVVVGAGAAAGPLGRRGMAALGLAVVALPWLAVKTVPVAAALAAAGLWALWRAGRWRSAAALAGSLAVAGVAFVVGHRLLYGGWTVYAAGDHFAGGEATVMGVDPDYAGRSVRLVGLLVDRGFGLVPWQPAWLLAVPAVAALAAVRPRRWGVLALPLAAGWLTATFAALTMHGWWFPGRQVVAVLPLAVVAVAWWAARLRHGLALLAAAAVAGAVTAAWYGAEVLAGRLRLVIDVDATTAPLVRLVRPLLPDYRSTSAATWVLHAAWLVAVAALAVAGRRSVAGAGSGSGFPGRPRPNRLTAPSPRSPVEEPCTVPSAS